MSEYGYLAFRNADKPKPSVPAQNGQGLYRPPTNGTTGTTGTTSSHGSGAKKRTSMSSFPASRPLSESSHQSKGSKSHISPSPELTQPLAQQPSNLSNSSSAAQSTNTSSSNASPHSSLLPQQNNPSAHSQRKLRSQYPRGDTEQHVEYILVASFDIDRGPIMEHQYPVAITGDEHMLAELMLPDQAHVRNQDWTIFFLHKDTTEEEAEAKEKAERRRMRQRRRDIAAGLVEPEEGDEEGHTSEGDSSSSDESDEGGQGPPLIYVLNLVNTKQDKTAKRGAVVRAMAICTRHPFLHIYKPLLLLALEEYFKAPTPSTLVTLYDAVNNMDLSLMPKLSLLERYLLQASDNKDLFVEKFEQMIQIRMAEDRGEKVPLKAMYTNPASRPTLSRTGTKAAIMQAVHSDYSVPRDTHEFETKVVYNGIPVPIKVPVAISPETVGDFSLIKLIQTFNDTHQKAPQPFALHQHLTTSGAYTHPIIVLVNAMLTQKRVIFLGHNRPSGEVAEAVLAACALASGGILRGFTRHAFPYTDLSKIDDLLKVPGFIAGVTNPTFENHPEWWDVLCDIPSGRIKISSRIAPAEITEQMHQFQQQALPQSAFSTGSSSNNHSAVDPTGDVAFMNDILSSIAQRHGEGVVRSKWRMWVERFTRIAAAFEEGIYGASALIYLGDEGKDRPKTGIHGHGYVWSDDKAKHRELTGNAPRIIGWRNTRSYYGFIQDTAQLFGYKPVKTLDLHHLHDRLQNGKLSQAGSAEVYNAFSANIQTYDEICQLLTVCPESRCGLFYIALGLFHKDVEVRRKVIVLLERIAEHEAGRHWWNALSKFEKLAFERIKKQMEKGNKRLSDTEVAIKKSPFIGLRES